jgi:hypothetical protein
MKLKELPEVKLLCRYDRLPSGSLKLVRPYVRGVRDDRSLLKADCLAFERDLSTLPEDRKEQYLAFEEAYTKFYRLWTGSGDFSLRLSRSLDLLQADFEKIRRELDCALDEIEGIPTYSSRRKVDESAE